MLEGSTTDDIIPYGRPRNWGCERISEALDWIGQHAAGECGQDADGLLVDRLDGGEEASGLLLVLGGLAAEQLGVGELDGDLR